MSENTPLIHARGFTALTVEQPGEVLTECFPAESVLAPGNMHRRECRERKEDPCAPRRDRTISNDWLATDSAAATQPARAPAHPWRRMIDQSHQTSSTSFRRQADLSDDAERQPGQALSGSERVTAQLVLPERMHVKIPIIASMKRDKHGEKLLCLRIPGTRSKALVSLHVSGGGINLSRHWGRLASTDRVVELSVPGDEKAAGNVLLVLDSYDSMQRLASMVLGRDMPDSTLQVPRHRARRWHGRGGRETLAGSGQQPQSST